MNDIEIYTQYIAISTSTDPLNNLNDLLLSKIRESDADINYQNFRVFFSLRDYKTALKYLYSSEWLYITSNKILGLRYFLKSGETLSVISWATTFQLIYRRNEIEYNYLKDCMHYIDQEYHKIHSGFLLYQLTKRNNF